MKATELLNLNDQLSCMRIESVNINNVLVHSDEIKIEENGEGIDITGYENNKMTFYAFFLKYENVEISISPKIGTFSIRRC